MEIYGIFSPNWWKFALPIYSSFPNIFTLERNGTSKKQEEQSINIHFNLSWVFKASCTQNIESGFITFNLFAYILCRSQFKFSESISARRLSIETQFIPQVTKQRSNKHVLLITKLVEHLKISRAHKTKLLRQFNDFQPRPKWQSFHD